MRLLVLCIAILTLLLGIAWCYIDIRETQSLSWGSASFFLPSLLSFLGYAKMEGPATAPAPVSTVSLHDRTLFAEFQAALPFEPTIRMLRDSDFGADYRSEWLEPLNRFVNEWNDPNREFLDASLEAERKVLYQAAYDLAMDFARETVPNDNNPGWRTVYPWNQRGGPRPAHVQESARVLNSAAHAFVPHYDRFVRLARERLDSPA